MSKLIGKKLQNSLFCDGSLYAVGGRPPIQWKNEHETACPPFGHFQVAGYDVTKNGAPLVRGTRNNGNEKNIFGFNLDSEVPSGGYGCCRFDMPLVAYVVPTVGSAGTMLGTTEDSWVLGHSFDVGKHQYRAMGPSHEDLVLITEPPECKIDGKNRFAIAIEPHTPIIPNTIVGVYYVKWNCSGGSCKPCIIEWMWAAYGWLGFEPIGNGAELELTYMDDMEHFWDLAGVPEDDPDDKNIPRNLGPWFITDGSCPDMTPEDGYDACDDFEMPTGSISPIIIP